MFDWRQLHRYRIAEKRLPANSIIINKSPSFWDAYKWWIVAGITVVLTESLLSVLLLFHRIIRRNAEKELQIYREKLEDLVEERTRELRRSHQQLEIAKERAEKANRSKSNFLATMSHELRTPLNVVLGYAQLLQHHNGLHKKVREGLDIIFDSGSHLLTLINEILDLSRIEAGKLELHPGPLNLVSFLESVTTIIQVQTQEKQLTFVYEPDTTLPQAIVADEKCLRQVLLNLLWNAVKFTESGGTICFRVTRLPGNGRCAMLRFEVEDTGVGIAPDHIDTIFQPFEQVGDIANRAKGSGLGLAISRQIVGLLGGELQIASQVGEGSTFWFDAEFPVSAEEFNTHGRERRRITGYEGPRRTILIVDDTIENRLMLKDTLKPLGFVVHEAQNGVEGVEKTRHYQPDLILMDLVMPEMTGFEATQKIRNLENGKPASKVSHLTSHISHLTSPIPIIAVSASAFTPNRHRIHDKGFDAFLLKPVDIPTLFATIQHHLGLRWIYAERVKENRIFQGTEAEIIAPPQADLEALYDIAMTGIMERVEARVIELEQADSKYAAFTQHVKQFAENFEDEQLQSFLKQFLSE